MSCISNHAPVLPQTWLYLPFSTTCFLSAVVVVLRAIRPSYLARLSPPPELAHPKASLHGMKNFLPLPFPPPLSRCPPLELAAHLTKKRTNKVQLRGWLIPRARREMMPFPSPFLPSFPHLRSFFTLSYPPPLSISGCFC